MLRSLLQGATSPAPEEALHAFLKQSKASADSPDATAVRSGPTDAGLPGNGSASPLPPPTHLFPCHLQALALARGMKGPKYEKGGSTAPRAERPG